MDKRIVVDTKLDGHINMSLDDFIWKLEDIRSNIPNEYRDSVGIEIDVQNDCWYQGVDITISYYRPETIDEEFDRLNKSK